MSRFASAWFACTADDTAGGTGSGKFAAGTYNVPTYPLVLEAYDEITWYVQVESVSGGPATWTLTPTAQLLVPHTVGDQFALTLGTQPTYFAVDATQKTALTLEGEDWVALTNAGGAPQRVKRTYRGFGYGMGLSLVVATTGGAAPTVNCTVAYVAKAL